MCSQSPAGNGVHSIPICLSFAHRPLLLSAPFHSTPLSRPQESEFELATRRSMDDDAASAQLATKLAESDSKARFVLGDDDGKMGDPEEAAKMPAGSTAGPSDTSEQSERSERGGAGAASEASCKEEYGGEEKAAEGAKASKIGLLRALLTRVRKRNAKGKKRRPSAPDTSAAAAAAGTSGPSKPSSFMEAQEAALRRASSSSKK